MAREPNWTDYGNLAANVAQLSRLGDIRDGLAQAQLAQAAEQKRIEYEDQARQVAFQIESSLHKAKSEPSDPVTTLVLLRMLQRMMRDRGIDASAFRQFADKDRVRQIQNEFETTMHEFEGKAGERLDQANLCWQCLLDIASLSRVMTAKRKSGQLESDKKALNQKVASLDAINSKRSAAWLVAGVFGSIFLIVTACVGEHSGFGFGGVVAFVSAMIAMIIPVVLVVTGDAKQKVVWEIKALEFKLSSQVPRTLGKEEEPFAELTLEECERLKKDRWAQVERILPPKDVPTAFVTDWCDELQRSEVVAEPPDDSTARASSSETTTGMSAPTEVIRSLAVGCASGDGTVIDKLRTLLRSPLSPERRKLIDEEAVKYSKLFPIYTNVAAEVKTETENKRIGHILRNTSDEAQVIEKLDELLQSEPEFYDCLVASPIAQQIEPWSSVVAGHRSKYEQRLRDEEERKRRMEAELKQRQEQFKRRWFRSVTLLAVGLVIFGAFAAVRMWSNYVHSRHLDTAKIAINNTNWSRAIEELNAALAMAPSSRAWRDLALAYRRSGKLAEASGALRKCQPSNAVGEDWKVLGDEYVAVTNWQNAMDCYHEAAMLLPWLSSVQFALANVHRARGEVPQAIAIYEEVVSKNGMDTYEAKARAEMELGKLYQSRGDLDSAARWFGKALPDPEAALNLGKVYAQQRKWQQATQVVEKATELRPSMSELWMLLGDVSDQVGNLDKALTAYQRALALNTNSFDALTALGAIHQRRGDASEAVAALSRAVQLNPTNASCWAYLACAYADLHDLHSAVECMQKAVRCKDQTLATKLAQIYIIKKGGDMDGAVNLYKNLLAELRQQPQAADVWLNLAATYLEQEKFDSAVESITSSQKISKSDRADTLLKMVIYRRDLFSAKAAIAGQNFVSANASLVQALKFDPNGKEAQELQKKIRPQVIDVRFKESAAAAEKYFSEGHYLEAIKAGEAAQQINPSGENNHLRELLESARQQQQKEMEFAYALDMVAESSKQEKWNDAVLYADNALAIRPDNTRASELKKSIQEKRQVWLQSVPVLDGNRILATCWDTGRDRANPDIFHSAYCGKTVTYTGKLTKVLPHPTGEPVTSSGNIVLQFKPEGHASKSFFVQAAARGLDEKTVRKAVGAPITITGNLSTIVEAPITILRFGSKSVIEMTNAWVVKIGP